MDLKGTLIQLEYSYIDAALAKTHGNVAQAAAELGLKRTTLIEKIRNRFYRTQGGLYDPDTTQQTYSNEREAKESKTNHRKDAWEA